MSKRHLAFEQTVLRPRAEGFRSFARPENLARITPRAMDFVLESIDTEMREGLLKLVAWPLRHLPRPPLTPDGVDFINQPAHVDLRPLLARMPCQLTPLAAGLATYLEGPRRASAAPAEVAR